jgi:hypothetical protein
MRFHPDMVWAWPATYTSIDPADWHVVLGKFDATRRGALYEELFRTRTLVHNRRETVRVEVSAQGDGALAVVDIDTRWRENASGVDDRWLGRTCKRYALAAGEWKMTAQTGALLALYLAKCASTAHLRKPAHVWALNRLLDHLPSEISPRPEIGRVPDRPRGSKVSLPLSLRVREEIRRRRWHIIEKRTYHRRQHR